MGTKIPADRIYHSDKVLAGVPQLLDDFHKLIDDQESADVVFLLGREEERIYGHRLILMARCKSFQVVPGVSGMSVSLKISVHFFKTNLRIKTWRDLSDSRLNRSAFPCGNPNTHSLATHSPWRFSTIHHLRLHCEDHPPRLKGLPNNEHSAWSRINRPQDGLRRSRHSNDVGWKCVHFFDIGDGNSGEDWR